MDELNSLSVMSVELMKKVNSDGSDDMMRDRTKEFSKINK